jgi:hypothetical protein
MTDTSADGEHLLGAWRLSQLEELQPDGHMHPAQCSGMLTFTRDGHMTVQVMYRDSAGTSSAYTQGGYEASFGSYTVDPRGRRFVYHVEGALVRSLIGQTQERRYALSGDELVITPVNAAEHWKVTWKRY